MVDYSKFKNIEDSDDEPIWETKETQSQKYKGLPQKALAELDAGAQRMRSRQRPCLCFFDFALDVNLLAGYEQEMKDAGAKIPESRYLGRVIVELDQAQHAPKLCENFRLLCTGERGQGVGGKRLCYQDRPLDFILPKYCIQASIPNEYSCWGTYLPDERLEIPNTSFERPGIVAVGNHGSDTNSCTFMITLNEASHLDGFNQIIGRVVRGMEVLRVIEGLPTDRKTQAYAERNVKTHWGGRPMVDVVIESCGELTDDQLAGSAPEDGDTFPEHPIDYSVKSDPEKLMFAQEKIREIGNEYFKKSQYRQALEKYRKAQAYLEPLLKKQHMEEFADEEASTMLSGGLRPKDRTDPVRADLTIKLNVCQVLLAMGEWRAAIATADGVVLELVGRHSRKGYGALPNDPLVVKALFRRAKGRIGLSDVSGEVSQLEEAIEDIKQALQVEPENGELKRELEKVRLRQRDADAKSQAVYEKMMRSQNN
eukprot:gb/GFBE01046488.1/.p1 GENE.gb/GFBE01046488.1/~~gb/GFBE01046488.1/.p1  ORF type:complete len:482 (+),score=130.38 gb/GFBE01046488.1/:1-1446(+)